MFERFMLVFSGWCYANPEFFVCAFIVGCFAAYFGFTRSHRKCSIIGTVLTLIGIIVSSGFDKIGSFEPIFSPAWSVVTFAISLIAALLIDLCVLYPKSKSDQAKNRAKGYERGHSEGYSEGYDAHCRQDVKWIYDYFKEKPKYKPRHAANTEPRNTPSESEPRHAVKVPASPIDTDGLRVANFRHWS